MSTPVVYPTRHWRHTADSGAWVGVTIPSGEVPDRIERIIETLRSKGHQIIDATSHDERILRLVHEPAMVDYMESAHDNWVAAGYAEDPGQPQVAAYAFPTQRVLGGRPLRLPVSPGALAGVYAMDTMTQIGEGTFEGARSAIDASLTATDLVAAGAGSAYAACRPPGHHAGRDFFGGSCYLNNAAVAAESLRDHGFASVAIVDIDAHHGNGTQEIFYSRDDVLFASVHVDPARGWFPHFVGHADEMGTRPGEGTNFNFPLEPGSGDGPWLDAIEVLSEAVSSFAPTALVVSLGVDAAVSDPESPLLVTTDGYAAAGERIASLQLPTVFVQEGGYDLKTIGDLVGATIEEFDVRRGEGKL